MLVGNILSEQSLHTRGRCTYFRRRTQEVVAHISVVARRRSLRYLSCRTQEVVAYTFESTQEVVELILVGNISWEHLPHAGGRCVFSRHRRSPHAGGRCVVSRHRRSPHAGGRFVFSRHSTQEVVV